MFGWNKLAFVLVAFVISVQAGIWKQKNRCPWVSCEPNCRKIKDESGCYKCVCEPLCAPVKCDPGCEVQKVFEGPCPGCECKDKDIDLDEDIDEPKVMCSPLKCPTGCTVEKEFDGPCPGCDCEKFDIDERSGKPKVVCSPVKCPPGCSIQKDFDGPCPGCNCKKEDIDDDIDGFPTDVFWHGGKASQEISYRKNLSTDIGGFVQIQDIRTRGYAYYIKDEKVPPKVMCTEVKCPPGCVLQEKFDGPCPGCDCKKDEDYVICPEIGFLCDEPKCKLGKDETGCETCLCEPECAPPKCKKWCKIKNVEGGCPVCECPKWRHG